MYELTTINTTTLANKELAKQLNIISGALALGRTSQWDVTFAVGNIIADELWEDDFDSQKQFADSVGLSAGTISQYKGALNFIRVTQADTSEISVGNAYLLSTLINEDDVTALLDFENWCKERGIDIKTLTQKALKQALTDYKDTAPSEVVAEETESVDESAENVVVKVGSEKFSVPADKVDEIKNYIMSLLA